MRHALLHFYRRGNILFDEKRDCDCSRRRVDLRRFKVSRVSVGGLGTSGKVEEPEGVVVEVESGEALGVEWNDVVEDAFQYLTQLFCLNGSFFLKF